MNVASKRAGGIDEMNTTRTYGRRIDADAGNHFIPQMPPKSQLPLTDTDPTSTDPFPSQRQERLDPYGEGKIVVIGGYGSVGRRVCRLLAESFPERVYAAGRSLEAARQFSEETNGAVQPLHWEVGLTDPKMGTADQGYDLADVDLIVMCLDQQHPHLIRQCLKEGTHYVDITAQADFLREASRLNLPNPQAAALLSVGLAPGLTNLLAARASAALERTERIEISLMLGLGESHGRAAIAWTIDQMGASFTLQGSDGARRVSAMTGGRTVDFGGALGRKRVYRFPFSDQFTLPDTLGIADIQTRLGFDINGVSQTAAALRRLGLFSLLRWRPLRQAIIALAGSLHVGSEQFAVQVRAYGQHQGRSAQATCKLHGVNQTDITARAAAHAAAALLKRSDLRGILHLEQLLDANSVWSAIRPASASELEFDLSLQMPGSALSENRA
ncbi:hypothetical protein B9G55_04055 [Saccharibacillus sp. O16]|nr:hypothetical protein B9G55_04055 [Saccharibacillus sp. O16]